MWAYLIKHRQASAEEVAINTGVSPELVSLCMARISSENWREEPATEGRKDDHDKPRIDLLPPELVLAVSQVLTFGAVKYSPRNWERGMAWSRPYAALMRHMMAWWAGEDNDPETGMSHLWHAGCCIAFLIAYEQRGVGTDDRHKTEVKPHAGTPKETSTGTETTRP